MLALVVAVLLAGQLPAFAQPWSWTWVRKSGTGGFNDSFCMNPLNPDILYASPGNNTIVISRDRGHTWQNFASMPGGNQIKAIMVSKRDTSVMLVAQEAGPPDRIMKSTNRGATWFQTLAGNFYYWGHPLAYEPSHENETVYTEAGNILYRSQDFGSTWDTVRVNPFGSNNQGWEDALICRDSANVLLVADNANGIWKSNNRGETWRRVYTASGEVPALDANPQNPAVMYAAKWGGGGGFLKTTDYGETWQSIALFNGKNMWGVAVSLTHPNYVVTGTWGHSYSSDGGIYISRDAGQTWERTFQGLISSSNHALYVIDTLSVFALQSDGIWKLRFPGTISGTVYADLDANGVRDSLEMGIPGSRVRISGGRVDSVLTDSLGVYRFSLLGPGSYSIGMQVPIPFVMTEPTAGTYSLTVSDGNQFTGTDFGLASRQITVTAPNGGENWGIGSGRRIRWSDLSAGDSVRIELSRNGGRSFDTLFISTPNDGEEHWDVTGPATDSALVRICSKTYSTILDTSDSSFTISPVVGVLSERPIPESFELGQNYPNPFNPKTMFEFRVPSVEFVTLKVYDLLGREVATLVNETLAAGSYEVIWEAQGIASGVYMYRIQAGEFVETKRLMLVR